MPHSRPRLVLRTLLVPCLLLATVLVGAVVPASADPAPGTTLTVSGPSTGEVGQPADFTARLLTSTGDPIATASVDLERFDGTSWVDAGGDAAATGAEGNAGLQAPLAPGVTRYRATYAGDVDHAPAQSNEVEVIGRYTSTLTLTGPATVVDEAAATLEVAWSTDGGPVGGGWATIWRRLGSGAWRIYTYVYTDPTGRAAFTVTPREDSRWLAVGSGGPTWTEATSPELFVDNVPAVAPVAYPATAPIPAYTPPQARATGAGANPVVTTIPSSVWATMVGRSWHRGCPVGRARLRLLRINYWGFDGYRYRGEMVLNSAVVYRAAAALQDMYNARLPIRRMYRVDRFGWSRQLRGANDYASMRADNTSAFNCRSVVNRPGVRSPHATGRSIDLNTWENPYRSRTGLVPNSWWAPRSHPLIAWRTSTHPVVRIWRARGFRWTYGTNDAQHVDGRTMVTFGGFSG